MNDEKLEKYLKKVNEEKVNKGLENFVPLYPMLKIKDNKLYVVVMLVKEDANVWDMNAKVVPEYEVLIDPLKEQVLSFSKTDLNDFKNTNNEGKINKEKEISKYTVQKTLEYKNYLLEDVKNEKLPLQRRLADIFGEDFQMNGEKININEYLFATFEPEIKNKIDELVHLLVCSKYTSLTFYYNMIFQEIIECYKENQTIDREKIKLCLDIMNYYYDGVVGIDKIFNME